MCFCLRGKIEISVLAFGRCPKMCQNWCHFPISASAITRFFSHLFLNNFYFLSGFFSFVFHVLFSVKIAQLVVGTLYVIRLFWKTLFTIKVRASGQNGLTRETFWCDYLIIIVIHLVVEDWRYVTLSLYSKCSLGQTLQTLYFNTSCRVKSCS